MTVKKLMKKTWSNIPVYYWFTVGWWEYLLEKSKDPTYTTRWHRFWCRAAGHPEGPWYYSFGNEPDMTCKDCGDEIW